MPPKDRYYQKNAKAEITQAVQDGHNILVCLPTGTGKTVIFTGFAADQFRLHKKVSLVLANRAELVDQADQKMRACGLLPSIINPKHQAVAGSAAYVASIETLNRRNLPYCDYLICDEMHIEQHDKILDKYREQYPHVKVIGFTATPERARGTKRPLHKFFSRMIEPIDTPTAISEGFLVRAVSYGAQVDLSEVKMTKGGEFDEASLFAAYNKSKLYDGVIDNYRKFADGKRAICFSVNVAHSVEMCRRFNEAGIKAVHVDGTTPEILRKQAKVQFAAGLIQVLCNCGVFTTGFDDPGIECVILNRATNSLPLYLQMCGRGSRPVCDVNFDTKEERLAAIEQSKKDKFIIIDHGSNWTRFGFWSNAREWSIDPAKRKKPAGVAPTRFCPNCEAIINQAARECEWCECAIPYATRVKELLQSEFVKLEATDMPPELAAKRYRDMTIPELELYRKIKDHHINWVVAQLRFQAEHLSQERYEASGVWTQPSAVFLELVKLYGQHKGYNYKWAMMQNYGRPDRGPEQLMDTSEAATLDMFFACDI